MTTLSWRLSVCLILFLLKIKILFLTLMYETGGRDFCEFACCVERVRRLVTPKVTLAGTASGLIQKLIRGRLGQ